MLEKYEIVKAMFHGFDYRARDLPDYHRNDLQPLREQSNGFLACNSAIRPRESTKEGRKRAHCRFSDAVLALSRAFAIAAASDEARGIRDEVGFFQTVRAAIVKSEPSAVGKSCAEHDLAVQQIVSRAVISTEIVDILEAAGLNTPDISILSDEFLAEIQGMEKKNLALEALLQAHQRRTSLTQAVSTSFRRAPFSQRLEEAIARYHSNAVTTDGCHSGTD